MLMKSYHEWRETIGSDQLQDEIILILHHVGDIEEALHRKDIGYALEGLKDVKSSAERLSAFLSRPQSQEIKRATSES